MIPTGWKSTTIGQHADVLTGFAFKSVDYTSNDFDVKLLRGDNITPGGLRWRDVKRFPSDRLKEVTRYQLKAGDFVVAMDRTWLPSGVKIAEMSPDDLPCLLVQRVARLRAKDTLHQELMKQFFSGHQFNQHVQAVQTQTAVPHISPADLRDYPIKLPPLSEQRRIAAILSTWDRAIETTEKLIANSEAQKKALMQQLLTGKKRLPGFSGEWRTRKLSEFCTVRRGASPRPIDSPKWFAESGRAWVRISDVTKSKDETLEHTDQYLSAEGAANSVAVDPGDLIMSICATIGVPKFLGIPACIHDGFVVFREVSPRLALPFLFYVLEAATERLANSGQPGTQRNLNTSIVGEMLVPEIEVAEQLAIAESLKRADNILRRISDKLKILKAEKSALMQQLLSGKRRVKIKGEAQAA